MNDENYSRPNLYNELADIFDADIYLHVGDIIDGKEDETIKWCQNESCRKNVMLILATYGGSPSAAYRIGRAFQRRVLSTNGNFIIFVPYFCKSAGTLLCFAANTLIISDRGELGPLDVQLNTRDELIGSSSGATPFQTLSSLRGEAVESFKRQLFDITYVFPRLSTKSVAEIATKLTVGLLTPLYEHFEPLQIGQAYRSMMIGKDYGERLARISDNLQDGAIEKLLFGYPDHAFVIDREEASTLFKTIERPSDSLLALERMLEPLFKEKCSGIPVCLHLNNRASSTNDPGTDQVKENRDEQRRDPPSASDMANK